MVYSFTTCVLIFFFNEVFYYISLFLQKILRDILRYSLSLWLNIIKCNGCIYIFYVYRNDAVDEINDSRSGGKVVDENKKNEKRVESELYWKIKKVKKKLKRFYI